MTNAITPASYCISLEMAQRPELHAAMRAAGVLRSEWVWSGIDPEIPYPDHNWDWSLMPRECVRICPEHRHIAYHIGELWAACKVLAERASPEHFTLSLQSRLNSTLSDVQAFICESDDYKPHRTQQFHDPDALAELCIALHKETT